jgi:antitoxin ParD1/3/4
MSKFDIAGSMSQNSRMNVSLTEPMEQFVRQKVAVGEYETASEVVREGLRLLRHRDEIWRNEVAGKIKAGMDSIRAGHTLSAERVQTEMATFKKKWAKGRATK